MCKVLFVVTRQPVLRAVERQAKLTIYVNPSCCTKMPYFVPSYVHERLFLGF